MIDAESASQMLGIINSEIRKAKMSTATMILPKPPAGASDDQLSAKTFMEQIYQQRTMLDPFHFAAEYALWYIRMTEADRK